jgi:hypothetical protein
MAEAGASHPLDGEEGIGLEVGGLAEEEEVEVEWIARGEGEGVGSKTYGRGEVGRPRRNGGGSSSMRVSKRRV